MDMFDDENHIDMSDISDIGDGDDDDDDDDDDELGWHYYVLLYTVFWCIFSQFTILVYVLLLFLLYVIMVYHY